MKDLSSCTVEELEVYLIECYEKKLDAESIRVVEELFYRGDEGECDDFFEEEVVANVKHNAWFSNLFVFVVPVVYALIIIFQENGSFGDSEIVMLVTITLAGLVVYIVSSLKERND